MDDRDLFDDFPKLPTDGSTGYCSTRGSKSYFDWEQEVAKPAMESAGYKEVSFHTVEADSFGPLIRGVTAVKDGKKHEWFYG